MVPAKNHAGNRNNVLITDAGFEACFAPTVLGAKTHLKSKKIGAILKGLNVICDLLYVFQLLAL